MQVCDLIISFSVRIRFGIVTKEQATDAFIFYLAVWAEVAQELEKDRRGSQLNTDAVVLDL